LKPEAETPSFALDASLASAMVEQAELKQITKDEMAAPIHPKEIELQDNHGRSDHIRNEAAQPSPSKNPCFKNTF
jgi:hypothetical protein